MDSQYLFHDADLLEPIAIVGLSLQFPGGVSRIDSLWEMIQQARCVSKEFPADRINANGAYWPQAPIRGGHFITDDITAFDAPFFSLSEVEAASIDPQQRLLLEMSYIAFENGILVFLILL
jgi:acyl transferase domain-containing protein